MGVHALLCRPLANISGWASAGHRLFPALVALSVLFTFAGLAVFILREASVGSIYMALGTLDLAIVLTARQGARGVRSACHRHPSGQVLGLVREFLTRDGTGYTNGRSFRFPRGCYTSLRIRPWGIRVGILEMNGSRSLVLIKGVGGGNEQEALRLLRALDGGLYRVDEKGPEGQWI